LTAIWQMLNWDKWFDDKYSKQTKNSNLLPFHIDEQRNFWKSDNVRNWRDLGYDFEILQGRSHQSSDDRIKILQAIDELYGKATRDLFDRLPDNNGYKNDFVITAIYDKLVLYLLRFCSIADIQRYALNGAPYKINLFLDGAHDFRGPESNGFVASIYNFSGDLESGPCGNCHRQKEEKVKCIAQVPVTVQMRRYLRDKETDDLKSIRENALQPVYMVWNSWGRVSISNFSFLHYFAD
jgi:tyrosinase